jgi:hypothetical protein
MPPEQAPVCPTDCTQNHRKWHARRGVVLQVLHASPGSRSRLPAARRPIPIPPPCLPGYTAGMKAVVIVLISLLVLALAMAVTCPDKASFKKHMEEVSAPDGGNILDKARGHVLTAQALLTAEYHDHKLWATAQVTRGSRHESYLGLFGVWINLSDDD